MTLYSISPLEPHSKNNPYIIESIGIYSDRFRKTCFKFDLNGYLHDFMQESVVN